MKEFISKKASVKKYEKNYFLKQNSKNYFSSDNSLFNTHNCVLLQIKSEYYLTI